MLFTKYNDYDDNSTRNLPRLLVLQKPIDLFVNMERGYFSD